MSGQSEPSTTELSAKVVTVSDGVIAGTRNDASGDALVARLTEAGWTVAARRQIADGIDSVSEALVDLADGFTGLIVTTGGTGFGPRDLTPEGTAAVLERQAPGLAEAMRTWCRRSRRRTRSRPWPIARWWRAPIDQTRPTVCLTA
ncbi:MAG: molybdopterin-binding protein [Actinomycetota bacterium]